MADYPRPPQVSRKRLTRAGKVLASYPPRSDEFRAARDLVDQWRAAHSYPMIAARNNLQARARGIDSEAIVVQRLKRLPSIINKVRRGTVNDLARLQDIGGCRAIMPTLRSTDLLCNRYVQAQGDRTFSYALRNDYIRSPKANGYRGYHVIGTRVGGKFPEFMGFHVELQLRTNLMHAWATAVEIVDTFAGTQIKTSNPDEMATDWDRYFALASAAMALAEGTPVPDGTPATEAGIRKAFDGVNSGALTSRIAGWSQTIHETSMRIHRGSYFLLELDIQNQTIIVTQYSNPTEADIAYRQAELPDRGDADSVLVAGRSLSDIRHAYPNYFADTTRFTDFVHSFIVG